MSWFRTEISINLNADKEPIVFTLGQVFLVSLLLLSMGLAYYFYDRYNTAINKEEEVRRLVREVAEHMLLPEAEIPTVATVTDPKALEGQPFFAHAETGDKVLVYPEAKKAVLYRPSIEKIIEVMPFAIPETPGGG